MLNKLINVIKQPARLILIVGCFVYTLLFILTNAGGGNNFFAVISMITILSVGVIALVATPVCLLFKKDNIAKIVFTVLVGFWLISTLWNQVGYGYSFDENNPAIYNTAIIFSFFYGLVLLSAVILFILGIVIKKDLLKTIALFVVLGAISLSFLCGLFWLINAGTYEAPWTSFVSYIADYFLLPPLICVGAIHFYL